GVRPVYAFTDTFKLVTELGHDRINTQGENRKLTKFTVAPTWSPNGPGFWNRPEFRLYYTYAVWNDAAQDAAAPGTALSDSGSFGGDRHGSNFGVQVEHWWQPVLAVDAPAAPSGALEHQHLLTEQLCCRDDGQVSRSELQHFDASDTRLLKAAV